MKPMLVVVSAALMSSAQAGLFDAFKSEDPALKAAREKNAATPVVPVLKTRTLAPGQTPVSVTVAQPASVASPVPVLPAQAGSVPAALPASAPAIPSGAFPGPTAEEMAAWAVARTSATDTAVPEVKHSSVYVKKPATPEQIAEARRIFLAGKFKPENARLDVRDADEQTVQCLLLAFPECRKLSVNHVKFSTLRPLALFPEMRDLALEGESLPDLLPLACMTKLTSLSFRYAKLSSLAPIGALPQVETINLYGATLDDFSPLAGMPRLRKVDFYATRVPKEKYGTLAALRQVEVFEAGLTAMDSVEWARGMTQMKELYLFAEKYADLSAVSTLSGLRRFKGWDLKDGRQGRAIGDLKFLSGIPRLEQLELPGSDYTGLEVIRGSSSIVKLDLSGAVRPVDAAIIATLPNLKDLNLNRSAVINFGALAGHAKLERLQVSKTTGIESLAPLAANTSLCSLTVSKDAFPAAELLSVTNSIRSVNRGFRLYEYK